MCRKILTSAYQGSPAKASSAEQAHGWRNKVLRGNHPRGALVCPPIFPLASDVMNHLQKQHTSTVEMESIVSREQLCGFAGPRQLLLCALSRLLRVFTGSVRT